MTTTDKPDDSSDGSADRNDDSRQPPPQSHITHARAVERSVAAGRDIINSHIFTGDIVLPKASQTTERAGSAPPRPLMVLGREEAIHDIKARLGLGSESGRPTIQVITAVRGWPGVGKTTLASALAHDSDIEAAFSDGVLWTSLGRTPNILSELAAWGRALGSGDLMAAQSITEASAQLASLLRNKRMFLIVDDIWEAEHARAFMVGGHKCATLFTTRSKIVAQDIAPTADDVYKLSVLTEASALALLQKLAPKVVTQYTLECKELARELDYLPLALQVAGRLLNTEAEYGLDVTNLLSELREGARLLEAKAPVDLSDVEKETTPTVAALLQKSTERLEPAMRDYFAYLGVFVPEPASFDLAALSTMWQLPDPLPIVKTLVKRGLLEPAGAGRYQMHALLIMHARSYLT